MSKRPAMRIAHIIRSLFFFGSLIIFPVFSKMAFGGPPFLTDDPEPVEFKHWEAYLFSAADATRKDFNAVGPAFEFNVGALPNLQLHLVVPLAYSSPKGGPSVYGLGDTELGFKYRFVQETDHQPQIAIFPMLEIPTGNNNRGLGNGQAWGKLPL